MRARMILTVLAVLAATGCSSTAATTQEVAPSAGPAFTVSDPWVKAADSGMTAAFGTLTNNGPAAVTITKAETDISPMELHEMAMQDGAMVMRPKEGGLEVPAGGRHVLEPGGDHLMLMKLAKPVRAGDEVTITLTFSDGTTSSFTAVGKPFTGAQESYAPSMGPM